MGTDWPNLGADLPNLGADNEQKFRGGLTKHWGRFSQNIGDGWTGTVLFGNGLTGVTLLVWPLLQYGGLEWSWCMIKLICTKNNRYIDCTWHFWIKNCPGQLQVLAKDEEVDRVNPLCTTSKFSWKVYIGTVLFKPWIFRQWLCGCGGYERVCTLCNLFGNHFLEQHSSHIYIKGSLEYSGLSRNYSNATGSGSVIERFQIQLQNDCKRSINHRVAKWSTNYRYSSELECVNKDQKQEVAVFSNLLAVLWFFFFNGISSYCR